MAQIVAIDKDPRHNQAIGDIVAVHDDDVELTGAGYASFVIHHVQGMTAAEVQAELYKLIPEQRPAWKAATDKWSLDEPEQKVIWKDTDGDWKFRENTTPLALNLAALDSTDLSTLLSAVSVVGDKVTVLAKITDKVNADAANSVLVTDLNK